MDANESTLRVLAYFSPYLFWGAMCLLGAGVVFIA